ncbi:MAG: undecaprenyl/decaprenyl-phosphate alpha-N-acetylglucosaminyl 1-phosphate transferase [Phycisphaerae bacterium]|nr:undecaprenyl/decaprenyl-phosphate alpha-N-acetylglucosaminyl 1-phosphate transferase [Phycisphaerae bacterium]
MAEETNVHWLTANEVLSPYIYVFYAAFLVSFFFTPIMRVTAMYFGIVDAPDRLRKMHTAPVAYLGGMAVFLGWLAGLAMSQFLYPHRTGPGLPDHVQFSFSIIIGACMIVSLGLWDDLRVIKPYFKILGQVAAALVLLSSGVGTNVALHFIQPVVARVEVTWPSLGWENHLAFYSGLILLTSGVISVAVVVFCCNATNLMDGLDGLCGGVTAITAGGFLFLAVYMGMSGGTYSNSDAMRVVLGLALLGGVLGFVPYNFNPASIFMGDTGSMFLGFSCATLILSMADVEGRWFLAAGIMFALPVLDTALAFARRYVNGRPMFSPDKFHFHHQLVARGFTVRRAVITSYALAIAFTVAGGAIVVIRERYAVSFYLVLFGYIVVAAFKMGMVHEKPTVVQRRPLDGSGIIPEAGSNANTLEIRDTPRPSTAAVGGNTGWTVAQQKPIYPGTTSDASA